MFWRALHRARPGDQYTLHECAHSGVWLSQAAHFNEAYQRGDRRLHWKEAAAAVPTAASSGWYHSTPGGAVLVLPYQEVALSKINLVKVMPFMTPSVASRISPPQETPAAVRDSLPPASISTPEQPTQPPKPAVALPSPETSESTPAAPTTVRTIKKGDQVASSARNVWFLEQCCP